jgi:hypothetical protein
LGRDLRRPQARGRGRDDLRLRHRGRIRLADPPRDPVDHLDGRRPTVHQPDTGGTYTNVIPAADILLRPKAGDLPVGWPPTEVHISRGTLAGTVSAFGRIDNGCTITGNYGFATTPPEIQAIVIDAVVIAYAHRKDGSSGAVGPDDVPLPPWARFFSRGSPQRDTLNRYRHQAIS